MLIVIFDIFLSIYLFIKNIFLFFIQYIDRYLSKNNNTIYIIKDNCIISKENESSYLRRLMLLRHENNDLYFKNNGVYTFQKFTQDKISYLANNFIIENINNNILCDYCFIIVKIKSNDNEYDITSFLKNSNTNYYIVNNILFNDNFMNWLLINSYNIDLNNYEINLIDNNIKNIIIDKSKFLKLNKNNYEIITK